MRLKPMLLRATADGRSSLGTMSPIDACHEGMCRAVPQPMEKVKLNSSHGDSRSRNAKMVSPTEATSMKICAASMMRRLSTLSASAPAINENSMMGRTEDAWTSATIWCESDITSMIQAAATA